MGDNNVALFKEIYDLLSPLYPELAAGCNTAHISGENKHLFNSSQLEDHHALIPLKNIPDSASPDEKNIYGLVLASFFTVIKDAYIYDLHQLLLHCGEHCFSASLRTVIAPGWKAKSGSSADEEEEEKTNTIQDVRQFDHTNCAITQVVQEQKKTTPPKHYTMASLLAFMEHPKETGKSNLCGLGTPATRAEIIKDLIDRKYISVSAKNIVATDKAVFLFNRLSHMPLVRAFASVSKTTEMEQQLKENPHTFEADVTALLKSALVPLNTQTIERFGASAAGSCPLCGKPIREGKASWYCSGYKTDNCTFTIWKQAFGTQFTAQDVTQLLSGKLTKTKACTSKAGKKFNAQFKLTDAKLEPVFENKKGK